MRDDVNQASEKKQHVPGPMYEVSRKLLLAAIGAVSFAQDEVDDFIDRLVERGEIAEKEGRQLMKEVMEKRAEKRNRFRQGTAGHPASSSRFGRWSPIAAAATPRSRKIFQRASPENGAFVDA